MLAVTINGQRQEFADGTTILAACRQFNVPCACIAFRPEEVEKRLEQGFRIIITIPALEDRALAAGKKLARR